MQYAGSATEGMGDKKDSSIIAVPLKAKSRDDGCLWTFAPLKGGFRNVEAQPSVAKYGHGSGGRGVAVSERQTVEDRKLYKLTCNTAF